jgi:GDP/UDP-N,N'-diacetylbacillosamine 2-epimerase (hydrolysing)
MGEQDFRIYVTGAPLVDELANGLVTAAPELRMRYRLKESEHLILTVQHPLTEEEDGAGDQVNETINALTEIDWPTIFVYPNGDAGSELIRSRLIKLKRPHIRLFRNLPRQDYLGLMKMADVVVGNSSSGVMEAPTFGKPAVNIGRRQNGRPQAGNVVNVGNRKDDIVMAVRTATSPEFIARAREAKNPYGDGTASHKIVNVLKEIEINQKLLQKEMAY